MPSSIRTIISPNKILLAKALYNRKIRLQKNPLYYFEPQEYQKPFLESTKKDKSILGGNRSGKTITSAYNVIKSCTNNSKFKVWCATWSDLSVPVQQKEIYGLLPRDESVGYARFSEQRGFRNKIIILVKTAINPPTNQ